MSDQSTEDLEHQAESIRSQVVDTAESLREKMSAGHLVDEVMTGMSSVGSGLLSGVRRQAQANPLPLVLIGVGVAWAIFGSSSGNKDRQAYHGSSRPSTNAGPGATTSTSGGAGGWAASAGEAASSISQKVGEAVADLPGAGQAQDSLRAVAGTVTNQDPLLLAAMGLAFGAALGAMLPGTRIEDQTLGSIGETLRETGEAGLKVGIDKVKDAAGQAVEAAQETATDKGLLPNSEGPTVANRLSDVAGSALDAARKSLREGEES